MSQGGMVNPERGGLLLLQPAFLGDVVLSTALIEAWHHSRPDESISIVVRREAAGLFEDHPFIDRVHVWDRRGWRKYPRLVSLASSCREQAPDRVVNLHRFASMAWLARRVGARQASAFEGSPLAGRSGVITAPHSIGDGRHEIERNHSLIADVVAPLGDDVRPRLRPGPHHLAEAEGWPRGAIVLAPGSVWTTKRWPAGKWAKLADGVSERWPDCPVVLLGGPADRGLLTEVRSACETAVPKICAGELGLLGAAALMLRSRAVVSNDSAPLHMAGAVNCPVVGVFCSTTPSLVFGVLPVDLESGRGVNVEIPMNQLDCKPCGVHGKLRCPEGHFRCGRDLAVERVMSALKRVSTLP